MSQNGQPHLKNLAASAARCFKCLTILGHYALDRVNSRKIEWERLSKRLSFLAIFSQNWTNNNFLNNLSEKIEPHRFFSSHKIFYSCKKNHKKLMSHFWKKKLWTDRWRNFIKSPKLKEMNQKKEKTQFMFSLLIFAFCSGALHLNVWTFCI